SYLALGEPSRPRKSRLARAREAIDRGGPPAHLYRLRGAARNRCSNRPPLLAIRNELRLVSPNLSPGFPPSPAAYRGRFRSLDRRSCRLHPGSPSALAGARLGTIGSGESTDWRVGNNASSRN